LRGPANDEERKAVFETSFKEFEDLWKNISLTETEDYIVTPYVTHVGPYDQADIDEARRVHNFYMKDISRAEIEKTKDLREFANEAYKLSSSTHNTTCMFRKDCNTDLFKTKLFGPSKRLLYPEVDTDLEKTRKDPGMPIIYDTYMKRCEKYALAPQPELNYEDEKNCPVPRSHTDKRWIICCEHFFDRPSKVRRHVRKFCIVILETP
jgi:hypothetical protein